jgi:hypothetical protein
LLWFWGFLIVISVWSLHWICWRIPTLKKNGFVIRTSRLRLSQWNSLDMKVRSVRSCINVHSAWETAMESDIREINFIGKANRNPLYRGSSLLYVISPYVLRKTLCILCKFCWECLWLGSRMELVIVCGSDIGLGEGP